MFPRLLTSVVDINWSTCRKLYKHGETVLHTFSQDWPCSRLAGITRLKGLKGCSNYLMSGSNPVSPLQRGWWPLGPGRPPGWFTFACKQDAIKSKSWLLPSYFSRPPSANRGPERRDECKYVLTFCCHYLHLYWAFFAQRCCFPKRSIFEQPHTSTHPVLMPYHNTHRLHSSLMLWDLSECTFCSSALVSGLNLFVDLIEKLLQQWFTV